VLHALTEPSPVPCIPPESPGWPAGALGLNDLDEQREIHAKRV
jgi:hypothetical protein